jgi:uncharacterized membrane protein YphA (DoxX/SURF4 family)
MTILFMAHSGLRYLILLVAAIAVVKFAIGWLQGSEFKGMDRGLTSAFSGLMDLQVTLGLIFLLWDGFTGRGFPLFRIEHAVVMVIAAVVAHLPMRWKNTEPKRRFRNTLFTIIGSLLLVIVGLLMLPGGLSR